MYRSGDMTNLGLACFYDSTNDTTQISWSWPEDSDIEYFVLEYWDDNEKVYKPYDGQLGIIKVAKY